MSCWFVELHKIAVKTSPGWKVASLSLQLSFDLSSLLTLPLCVLCWWTSGQSRRRERRLATRCRRPRTFRTHRRSSSRRTHAVLNSQCCAVSDVMLQIVLTGGIICAHPKRNSWVWGNNCALGCDGGLNVHCAHELPVSRNANQCCLHSQDTQVSILEYHIVTVPDVPVFRFDYRDEAF